MYRYKLIFKISIFLSLLLATVFLSSCIQDSTPKMNCNDNEVAFNTHCISYELYEIINTVNATYTFSEDLSIEEERVIIDTIEVIVDEFILNGLAEDGQLSFNINYQGNNFLDKVDGTVNLNISSINSFDAILITLFSLFDTMDNYGLIYGIAINISIELGYIDHINNEYSNNTVSHFINNSKSDLMDLTYPCFSESYTSVEDIEYVKQFSIQFTKYIIDSTGIQTIIDILLLTEYDEFESQYKFLLNEWIEVNGFNYDVKLNSIPIFFDREIGDYYSIWYTQRASWYLNKNYENKHNERILPKDFLMNDYKELKNSIITFEEEFERIDSLLKVDGFNYIDLEIFIHSGTGNFYFNGRIDLTSVPTLSHEYVHYITFQTMDRVHWLEEAIATFYSFDFLYMEMYMDNLYFGENDFGELTVKLDNTIARFHEIKGVEVNYSDDKLFLNDIYVFLEGKYDDVYGQYNSYSMFQYISFVNYLIETYGEDTLLLIYEDTYQLDNLTDKTWNEIVVDWENHIKLKFE